MNIRRDGNVLHISDSGFYEPPLVPTVAQRKRARMFWSLGIIAALTAVTFALAGANKLQRWF